MKPSHALTAIATSAGFLIAAAGAQAASTTFCVDQPSCTGTPAASFQNALDFAQFSPEPDRIEIGPGTYYPGPGKFTYAGSATNTVDIVGAGADKTHLGATSNSANLLILDYADVSDLEIQGASPDTAFPNAPAALELGHGTARRLTLTNGVTGALLKDGATLASSHVTGSGKMNSGYGVDAEGFKTAVLDSSIDSPAHGVFARSSFEIARTRVSATLGINIYSGADARVTDSLIEGSAQPGGAGIVAQGSTDVVARISGTTIVSPALTSIGILAQASNSGSVQVSVENSIIVAPTSFGRQADMTPADVTVRHSAFDPSAVYVSGPGSLNFDDTDLDVAPGFVDAAAGDFHLRPDSPLIDKGTASPSGGLGASDFAGDPRSLDGDGDGTALPDIGAYESPAVAPKNPPSDPKPPVGGPQGDPQPPVGRPDAQPPVLSPVSLTHRRFAVHSAATAFRFTLSEDAKVTIKVGRRKLARSAHLGANRVGFSGRIGRRALKPGRYVAKVTARDADGHVSKTRTVKFKIIRQAH